MAARRWPAPGSVRRSHLHRTGFVAALAAMLMLVTGQIALALPSEQPDGTAGYDAKVRAVFEAGGNIWVGGAFDNRIAVNAGPAVAIDALDPQTGGAAAGVNPPELGGTNPIVYDFSESGGVLYAAGKFTYPGGKNLIGIDPSTGGTVQTFSTPVARTVMALSDRILIGKKKILAYSPSGGQIGSFNEPVALVDDSIRGHNTPSQFRDIGVVDDGDGIAVGQFDFVNGESQKVAVKFDVQTGAIRDWDLTNINANSGAFGIELELVGPTLYVAAGGSDFAAAYRVSDGQQVWKTDTSGSSQAIALWDADTVIVGGHFEWVAFGGVNQCGSNGNPNTNCLHQPRLVAMDASTGAANDTWRPSVCCLYNGVWSLIVENGRLHIGGEFTKVGGNTQKFYARFSEGGGSTPPPPPSGDGSFSDGFESGTLGAWTSSSGLSVQTAQVHGGTYAATNAGSSAWAMAQLSSAQSDLYARMWVNVTDRTDTFQVMRLRDGSNKNVVILTVVKSGKLRIRNVVTATNTTLTTTVHPGWNDLQLHAAVAGGSGDLELWVNGEQVADLGPANLGSDAIERVEIGNRSGGKTYAAYYDDVELDSAFIS